MSVFVRDMLSRLVFDFARIQIQLSDYYHKSGAHARAILIEYIIQSKICLEKTTVFNLHDDLCLLISARFGHNNIKFPLLSAVDDD